MAQTTDGDNCEGVVREYVLDARIVEHRDDESAYRFEAPQHRGRGFESLELAEVYADVYFAVNGFQEADTGDRGIPPEVIQGGRDAMAAYLYAQTGDDDYVASFYGVTPGKISRYVSWVRERAQEVRDTAATEGVA